MRSVFLITLFVISQLCCKAQAKLACTYATKYLPVQHFINADDYVITDTFWIKNIGDIATVLEKETNNYYTVLNPLKANHNAAMLMPKDSIAIVYKRIYKHEKPTSSNYNYVIDMYDDVANRCTLNYDKEKISLCINYKMMHENANVTIEKDGCKSIVQKYKSGQVLALPDTVTLNYVVNTYPDGYIKECGKQLSNYKRIGMWAKYEKAQPMQAQQWQQVPNQKLLTISIGNDSLKNCWYELYKGWQVPARDSFYKHKKGFIGQITIPYSSIDMSITISSKNGSVKYPLQWHTAQEVEEVRLYLLKENQAYYYSNKIKVPIDTEDNYRVVFNPFFSNAKFNKLQYFDKLKSKYPTLQFTLTTDTINKWDRFRNRYIDMPMEYYLNLSACKAIEKEMIKQLITKDTNIILLSKILHTDNEFYAEGTVYINTVPYNPHADTLVINLARKLGFNYMRNASYAIENERIILQYQSKIIDETFIKNYNTLSEQLLQYKTYLQLAGHKMPVQEADSRMYKD